MPTERPRSPSSVPPVRRFLLTASGLVCVALGVVGLVVPGLPTTPFLLAASYLFARSSPRLTGWLAGHRWFGPYLRAVRDDRAMPRRAKAVTLTVLWLTLLISGYLLAGAGDLDALTVAMLLVVGMGVTWFVGFRLATARPPRTPPRPRPPERTSG